MRISVIGATGLLGRVLLKEWDGDTVTGVGSRELDIRNRSQVEEFFIRCRPDWTILLAAYTDVDGCERDPKHAREANCEGAIHVARAASVVGSRLLFVSTDYVFSGEKNTPYETQDATCPINNYGRSKAEAEKGILAILPECCIVRTSWLFGATGRCFPNTILEHAQREKSLRIVADQTGSPTFNRDLARAIAKLVRADARGIVHASNTGQCSWFDFAKKLLSVANLDDVAVESIRGEDLPRPARRPKYSVLSSAGLEKYGIRMRPWTETLGDYFSERGGESNVLPEIITETGAAFPVRAKSGKSS